MTIARTATAAPTAAQNVTVKVNVNEEIMTTPLMPEPIAAEVRRIIADSLSLPLAEVTLDRRLDAAGLGIDSLGLIKLNVEIEERFDIAIPDFIADDPSQLRSVGDVVNLVADCVAKAGAS